VGKHHQTSPRKLSLFRGTTPQEFPAYTQNRLVPEHGIAL
jgi:hypothetical protein